MTMKAQLMGGGEKSFGRGSAAVERVSENRRAAATNPFSTTADGAASRARRWLERSSVGLLRAATYVVLCCGLAVFGDIALKGSRTVFRAEWPFVNVEFLTQAPESLHVFEYAGESREMGDREFRAFAASERARAVAAEEEGRKGRAAPPAEPLRSQSYVYAAGGIWPCIVGTVLLVTGAMGIALVLGVGAAIFLSEYAREGRALRLIRLSILNLAGVPSIVFGLFGFALFVNFFGWNVSLLAGWCTLAVMVLPVVITAAEEALKAVPRGLREGSLALGATPWQTIRRAVLPCALPGIFTSSILGIARVAGETAPIMFTAAYVVRDKLPWEVERISDFVFQGVMALPYHIYVVATKIPQNEYSSRVQYGTAFVFLGVVGLLALSSLLLRNRFKTSW
ncbi:phosphate ABC transporter permease PstA [Cephaloticoccus primus]|uniref:phosphate ABC transporter permease PstA n=1 Tax=Cephaloticoccus primus TaxID=1548207 RepID=UPI000A83C6E0|nr:phosphate ABC transporter permease PstA [Cephaloticoccus primus]